MYGAASDSSTLALSASRFGINLKVLLIRQVETEELTLFRKAQLMRLEEWYFRYQLPDEDIAH